MNERGSPRLMVPDGADPRMTAPRARWAAALAGWSRASGPGMAEADGLEGTEGDRRDPGQGGADPEGVPGDGVHDLAPCFAAFDRHYFDEHGHGPPEERPGLARRWLNRGGALVDQVAVRVMEPLILSMDRPDCSGDAGVRARLAWYLRTYGDPRLVKEPARFFRACPDPPAMNLRRLGSLPGGERLALSWESTYRTYDPLYQEALTSFRENNQACAQGWLHGDRGRPVVVLANPWASGYPWIDEPLYDAQTLFGEGLDVVLFTLPFHGRRTPRHARFSGQLFPNRELRRTCEAFGQCVADLRVLFRWLRNERGCGPLGMAGLSLGGYVTGLAACLEPDLAFAVPIMPPSSLADGLWQNGRHSPARLEVARAGLTLDHMRRIWAIHCPLVLPLRIPKERALIVWARADRVIPRLHALALWERWGQPDCRCVEGGHIMQIGRPAYLRELRRFIARCL